MSTPQNKLKRTKYPNDMSENGWKKLKAIPSIAKVCCMSLQLEL